MVQIINWPRNWSDTSGYTEDFALWKLGLPDSWLPRLPINSDYDDHVDIECTIKACHVVAVKTCGYNQSDCVLVDCVDPKYNDLWVHIGYTLHDDNSTWHTRDIDLLTKDGEHYILLTQLPFDSIYMKCI